MTHEEFITAIHAIKEFTAMIEPVEQEIERLRHEVKQYMTQHDINTAEIDGIFVTLRESHSKRFDITLFKEQRADLYEQFLTSTATQRLVIRNCDIYTDNMP